MKSSKVSLGFSQLFFSHLTGFNTDRRTTVYLLWSTAALAANLWAQCVFFFNCFFFLQDSFIFKRFSTPGEHEKPTLFSVHHLDICSADQSVLCVLAENDQDIPDGFHRIQNLTHAAKKKKMSDCCTSRVEGEGKVEQRRWREGGGVSNVSGGRTLLQQKADAARIVLHSITGWPGYHLYTTWLGLYADRTSAGGGGGGAETTPRPEVEW